MIAGYVRLSRDDDGQNYSSIENQKRILQQYANARHLLIDRWYEDDGVSGYRFDRPQFQAMMAALKGNGISDGIDTVLVKDFSRLGRHNAKVLLLLDEFQRRGCRLIAVDDNYDSLEPDDDIIGIKTWYNERYIKDTSRKIRRVLNAKQKDGTLLTQVPFGYRRNEQDRQRIEIVPEEAEAVSMIYELYQQGMGYRKLAEFLNGYGMPTPSLLRFGMDRLKGNPSRRHIALEWSDSMVKEILDNDFYTGTYRLHKRARRLIHGTDSRVPKKEQYLFPDHHPAIISAECFARVQQIKKERSRRRSSAPFSHTPSASPFSHLLTCKDCGERLIPIVRKNKASVRKYYICSTYNRKGKRGCSSSHLVEEWVLYEAVWHYIRLCRHLFSPFLSSCNPDALARSDASDTPSPLSESPLDAARRQLQTLLEQKVRDLSRNPGRSEWIRSAYDSLESQLLSRIQELEADSRVSTETAHADAVSDFSETLHRDASSVSKGTPPPCPPHPSAAEVLDQIIRQGRLTSQDLDLLIASILVDAEGNVEIRMRCFIPPTLLPLHKAPAARRYAGDGIRIYPEAGRD